MTWEVISKMKLFFDMKISEIKKLQKKIHISKVMWKIMSKTKSFFDMTITEIRENYQQFFLGRAIGGNFWD